MMDRDTIEQAWTGERIVWVTRSLLDYRVPVYAQLDALVGGTLSVIYNGDYVPQRAQTKLTDVLGERAVALHGEYRLGPNIFSDDMANRSVRIPWQPGLLREIRKRRPTMLISDGFFQWTAACLWMRAGYGIPHVMCYERTAHTERQAQWYRKGYRQWALRYVDAVCCSGRLCGAYVRSLGVQEERMTHGHMVADVEGLEGACQRVGTDERARIRERYGLRGTVFLYVGQLIQRKGILEMLRAWAQREAATGERTATLVIVGDGPELARAKAFCAEHRLDSVRVPGRMDYDDLAPIYAAADAFIIATLEDNWSLVVPEAMACGLPILCSTYNGCWPELVQPGKNGWVFDPQVPAEMVRAVDMACDHAGELKVMGERSREIVADHTPRAAARAILEACRIASRGRDVSA